MITKTHLEKWGYNLKKTKLDASVQEAKNTTKESLQLLWDNVNKGQKKQILKNPEVKEMFDRFGVEYESVST